MKRKKETVVVVVVVVVLLLFEWRQYAAGTCLRERAWRGRGVGRAWRVSVSPTILLYSSRSRRLSVYPLVIFLNSPFESNRLQAR